MKKCSKQELKRILLAKSLPSHEEILVLADTVSTVLDREVNDYRQIGNSSTTGSLLDFQGESVPDLPLIVVPDLHGRGSFLLNIINYKLPKNFIGKSISIFEALEKGLIRLVFVGDILHTEYNTKMRWLMALEDFKKGIFCGDAMKEEMAESLSLWYGVFMLKILFPEYCHVLKGNHENILNISGNGNFAFRKYADEGAMVKSFLQEYYGDDVLYMIHYVENALPLVVATRNCIISHAEPKCGFSKEEIINAKISEKVVLGLTWTDNGEAEVGSVEAVISNLALLKDTNNYVYIGGHRWVSGKYELRQNGMYIQIHNPACQNIALVYKDRKFNPDNDIVGVEI